jgi:hypothetical protein
MLRFRSDLVTGAILALGLLPALAFGTVEAQETPGVVAKTVAMGADRARLTLEFSDGSDLVVGLEGGEVRVDGETVGRYDAGGALEDSWRTLVARTVQLDDEDLPRALVEWAPPEGLDSEAAAVASRIDALIAAPFDTATVRARAEALAREADQLGRLDGLQSLALLSRLEVLAGLGDIVQEMDDSDLRVVVDDHLEIGPGMEIEGSVLVVDGSLDLLGTVRGDVLVIDGSVDLHPGSRITGTLNLFDAEVDNDGGEVSGGVEVLDDVRREQERELRSEILREIRSEMDFDSRGGSSWTSPFRNIFGAFGSILGTLVNILVLGALGAGLFHFAGQNMEAVAEVARDSTGRAAVVGFAGAALILPVFILGIVGLAVTIVGIPAIVLWVLLFPAAVILAGLMGYLAVARNLGVWLKRQRYGFTDWIRVTNPVTLVFGGLFTLAAPFILGEILGIVGFLGVLEVLLGITGVGMSVFAGAVGFGAVLITRGGRLPEEWGTEFFTRRWRGRGSGSWGGSWKDEDTSGVAHQAEEAAASGAAGAAATATEAMGTATEAVEEMASEVDDAVREAMHDAEEVIHDVAEEVGESVHDAVHGAQDAAAEVAQGIEDALDEVEESVHEASDEAQAEFERKRREYTEGTGHQDAPDADSDGEEHEHG